ncbi:hypothetical protein UPYG_G00275210 [Umbra pygmaea]|uniref:Linker for activation of T-cells family member 2 n=1 Tax=Umbra pygmaea TaxID=75934 RepID=A0ABD0W245_UMBPY
MQVVRKLQQYASSLPNPTAGNCTATTPCLDNSNPIPSIVKVVGPVMFFLIALGVCGGLACRRYRQKRLNQMCSMSSAGQPQGCSSGIAGHYIPPVSDNPYENVQLGKQEETNPDPFNKSLSESECSEGDYMTYDASSEGMEEEDDGVYVNYQGANKH